MEISINDSLKEFSLEFIIVVSAWLFSIFTIASGTSAFPNLS